MSQSSFSSGGYVRPTARCIGRQIGFVVEIMNDLYVPPSTSILPDVFLHADCRPFIDKVVWIHHSPRCFYFFNCGGICPHYTTRAEESVQFLQLLQRYNISVDVLQPNRSYVDPTQEVHVINESTCTLVLFELLCLCIPNSHLFPNVPVLSNQRPLNGTNTSSNCSPSIVCSWTCTMTSPMDNDNQGVKATSRRNGASHQTTIVGLIQTLTLSICFLAKLLPLLKELGWLQWVN